MTPKPLTDDQRRAAELLGQGQTQADVSEETGISTRNLRRLATEREDFAALVEEARDETNAVTSLSAATPRGVLEELLVATTKSGQPAQNLRLSAAVALSKLPDDSASDGPVVERVYVTPDHPDHDQVIAILEETPAAESVGIVDGEDGFKVLADRDVPRPDAASIHVLGMSGHSFPGEAPSQPVSTPSQPVDTPPLGDQPTADEPPRGRRT